MPVRVVYAANKPPGVGMPLFVDVDKTVQNPEICGSRKMQCADSQTQSRGAFVGVVAEEQRHVPAIGIYLARVCYQGACSYVSTDAFDWDPTIGTPAPGQVLTFKHSSATFVVGVWSNWMASGYINFTGMDFLKT